MGVTLKYIAQSAMDAYYRDFKGNTGFFELSDFIFRAAGTITTIYQKHWEQRYAELRQERMNRDELIGVDQEMLSVQRLKVENKPGLRYSACVDHPVMTFLYDKHNTGYQFLFPVEQDVELERGSMDQVWEYKYLPTTNRVFWWPQHGKIQFYQNGSCGVKEVDLYYIPSVLNCDGEAIEDAIIPDGLVEAAVAQTVDTLRKIDADIVKMSLNNNQNSIPETEISK